MYVLKHAEKNDLLGEVIKKSQVFKLCGYHPMQLKRPQSVLELIRQRFMQM